MKANPRLLFLPFILSFSYIQASTLPNVEILGFTTSHYTMQHTELLDNLYHIDKMQTSVDDVFGNLPKTEKEALKEIAKRQQSPDYRQKIAQIKESSQHLAEGWVNGIKRVPAVLFKQTGKRPQVVYGETDVEIAIQIFKKKQEQK